MAHWDLSITSDNDLRCRRGISLPGEILAAELVRWITQRSIPVG